MKKLLLGLLFVFISSTSAASEYGNYIITMMKNAQAAGKEGVKVEIPSQYVNSALEVAKITVRSGGYFEVFKRDGSEWMMLGWSQRYKNKQASVMLKAGEYAGYFVDGYKRCKDDYWVIGLASHDYYGNFQYGCGETFIGMLDQIPVTYKKWDYMNMLLSVNLVLEDSGLYLHQEKSANRIFFYKLKKLNTKKTKFKGKKSKL